MYRVDNMWTMFLIAGWISDWLWQGMFAAYMGSIPAIQGLLAWLLTLLFRGICNTETSHQSGDVPYSLAFYALGCGAIVTGVAGQLLDLRMKGFVVSSEI